MRIPKREGEVVRGDTLERSPRSGQAVVLRAVVASLCGLGVTIVGLPAIAQDSLEGVDLDVVAGGGPPFNMGGGLAIEALSKFPVQFEAMVIAGPSLGHQGAKLGSPVTAYGETLARLYFFGWKSNEDSGIRVRCTGSCPDSIYDLAKGAARLNALAIEVGSYWGALPFRWGILTNTYFQETRSQYRYVAYPALGLRWDSFNTDGTSLASRWTLGVRGLYGPLLAPDKPTSGETMVWGPPEDTNPPVFKSGGFAATVFGSLFVAKYLLFGAEAGGGAVPSSLWFRIWLGGRIRIWNWDG